MSFKVILKSLNSPEQQIVLGEYVTNKNAEEGRKNWRNILGGKRWIIDRRPGLDTLDHLALTVTVDK